MKLLRGINRLEKGINEKLFSKLEKSYSSTLKFSYRISSTDLKRIYKTLDRFLLKIDRKRYINAYRSSSKFDKDITDNMIEDMILQRNTDNYTFKDALMMKRPDFFFTQYKAIPFIIEINRKVAEEEDFIKNNCIYDDISISAYGPYRDELITKIKNIIADQIYISKPKNDVSPEYITVTKVTFFGDSLSTSSDNVMKKRDSELFLKDEIRESLNNFIERWKKFREICYSRSIPTTMGILLHGPKGTGKSSIIKMLASKSNLNADVVYIKPFDLNNLPNVLKSGLRDDDDDLIIVACEEIDILFDGEHDKEISDIQQLLSGMETPDNIVFVFTTNHLDELDDRITGRMQMVIEVPNLEREQAMKLVKTFGVNPDIILEDMEEYNPRTIENKIKEYLLTGGIDDEIIR